KARMAEAFEELAPNEASRKLPFWQDKVQRALEEKDMDAMRGYLLAAPAMLGRDLGKQVRVRAEAETKGTADERVIRAALQTMPGRGARAIEYEIGLPQAASIATAPPEPEPEVVPGEEIGEVLEAGVRPETDWRFRLLGSYGDLASMSQ